MHGKMDLKGDLEKLFIGFRWNIVGFVDDQGTLYELPDIPQVISGIFQELAKRRVIPFLKEHYACEIIEGGAREYPEITAFGGKMGNSKVAIDIKTTRRLTSNRVSGFSIGSYAGYFLHPERKMPGCKFAYGEFSKHWLVGFIYNWNPKAGPKAMVSDVEVIIQEKWRIASRSTATGTTFAISSVRNLSALRSGSGDFNSSQEFEDFWRAKGVERERRKV